MRFILTSDALQKFDNIRADYQKAKKVDIEKEPSMFGRPIYFGGTNVIERKRQIHFLEKIKLILGPNLLPVEQIKTPEQYQATIMANRVFVAACFYVQSQIMSSKRNSALYRLIDDYLSMTKENFLDDEDKELCLLAAD